MHDGGLCVSVSFARAFRPDDGIESSGDGGGVGYVSLDEAESAGIGLLERPTIIGQEVIGIGGVGQSIEYHDLHVRTGG